MTTIYQTLFGLDDLRVRRIEYRGEYNILKSVLLVDEIVVLQISPSFAPSAEIAFVRAVRQPYEFEEEQRPGWIRMGFIPDQTNGSVEGEMIELHAMPVMSALTNLDLTLRNEGITLDGVGYRFRYQTQALETVLTFANPKNTSLINLVEDFAKIAERGFRGHKAKQFVAAWKAHRKG